MEQAPIRVEPGEAGRLIVRLPYTPERVAKIKTVDGRRWHGPEKYWSVPRDEDVAGNAHAEGPRGRRSPLKCDVPVAVNEDRRRLHAGSALRH